MVVSHVDFILFWWRDGLGGISFKLQDGWTLACRRGLTLSSLMPISGVLARDIFPFKMPGPVVEDAVAVASVGPDDEGSVAGMLLPPALSESTRTNSSSSSSPSSRRSAHDLPA